ncbi:extensin [Erythrobacter sp. QSSC1-22B]|uniref:extensin family protein n=1 Tax=Erythrobacter sp. QSSC1-22B TaxID=1860125 RepID=UPI000805B623|nr:extensin family protein [Erythrobacter sp. QSSC1-22B]OBX20784.1 extensin [Erythrobacter sp. QSSC1-22B]
MRLFFWFFAMIALGGCSAVPQSREPDRPGARTPASTAVTIGPEGAQCLTELSRTGSLYSPLPDRYDGAGCQVSNSVRLDRLRGDNAEFMLSNLGPVACPLASAFAGWARFGVDRAARQLLGSPLVKIETMGSYSCRNVAGTGRLSAHARAEAIDIGAFVLADGRRISVIDGWSSRDRDEGAFLRIVHESACKRFGTVLGPDYNAAHRDHLHVELGSGSFCR